MKAAITAYEFWRPSTDRPFAMYKVKMYFRNNMHTGAARPTCKTLTALTIKRARLQLSRTAVHLDGFRHVAISNSCTVFKNFGLLIRTRWVHGTTDVLKFLRQGKTQDTVKRGRPAKRGNYKQ